MAKSVQELLKIFLTKELATLDSNIKITEDRRHELHLRAAIGDNAEVVLNQIIPCELKETKIKLSGSYTTQLIVLTKNFKSFKKGDSLYFVNNGKSKSGILRTKQLTPDALGFAGNQYTAKELYYALLKIVPDLPSAIRPCIESIIESSNKNKILIVTDGVSQSDLNIIAKDFGELTGALWALEHHYKDALYVKFPKESNSALVDYYIYGKNSKTYPVSAKAGLGAAPSLTSVSQLLIDGIIIPDKKDKIISDFITGVKEKSGLDAIIDFSGTFNTPGFKMFSKLGVPLDKKIQNIENFVADYDSWSSLKRDLSSAYDTMKRWPSDANAEKLMASSQKKNGIILSPLGYHLIDELNRVKEYTDFLTNSLNSLNTEQLYMDVGKNKLKYSVKTFSKSKFFFHFDSNIGNAANKKISFKMKK